MSKKSRNAARKVPRLRTDAEAISFLKQDLSALDFSQFKPERLKFSSETARLNIWLDRDVLDFFRSYGRSYQAHINAVLRVFFARAGRGGRVARDRKKTAR